MRWARIKNAISQGAEQIVIEFTDTLNGSDFFDTGAADPRLHVERYTAKELYDNLIKWVAVGDQPSPHATPGACVSAPSTPGACVSAPSTEVPENAHHRYLVAIEHRNPPGALEWTRSVGVGSYVDGKWHAEGWRDDPDEILGEPRYYVTHWAPLPPPPAVGAATPAYRRHGVTPEDRAAYMDAALDPKYRHTPFNPMVLKLLEAVDLAESNANTCAKCRKECEGCAYVVQYA
jgi:hypothetical protein